MNNCYTSVLMIVFHHFHHTEGLPAAEALRRTQLWALDAAPAVEELLGPGSDGRAAAQRLPWLRGRLPALSIDRCDVGSLVHHGR